MQSAESVTQLLVDWGKGDQKALDKLMPLVYSELRRLANNYLRHERQNHTLQPTALVNEAYLILIDHARQRQAAKRGGSDQQRLSITSAGQLGAKQLATEPAIDLLALHEALNELAEMDPQQGRIVELQFFGGISIEEIAEVMGIGHATVERDWKMARAWLRRKLE